MKNWIVLLALLCLVGMGLAQTQDNNSNANNSDTAKELSNATDIVQDMTGPNANIGVPSAVIDSAKCVAVVPNLIQAGFIVGGRHGNGVATCRTANNSWSPPAPFSITGASWGAQIGGQSIDLIMMVMNDQGMQQLRSGHFKLGGGASVAAGPVGRQASASAGWKAGILTYSRSNGAYIGAVIKGAELQQDDSATKQIYGRDVQFSQILNGKVQMPSMAEAHSFVNAVQKTQQSASVNQR